MNNNNARRGTQFATFRNGQLRTVGTGYVLPSGWPDLKQWNASDAQAIARMFDSLHSCEEAAARGKVFLLSQTNTPDHALFECFQVKNDRAEAVFCGNSTAAAGAFWTSISGLSELHFSVTRESRSLSARMRVTLDSGRFRVNQEWTTRSTPPITTISILGHEAVLCEYFNDYLLVLGPLKTDLRIISACWNGMANLGGKIALIEAGQPFPTVHFYNCNGLHGAAPQTGLATLALVGSQVGWVHDMTSKGNVVTPGGIEPIPAFIRADNGSVSIRLPEVTVTLNELSFARSTWLT